MTDMRRVAVAIVVIPMAALASPAWAQPAPWSPERITAGWVFTPSFGFGVLSDSNPTTQNEGNPKTPEMVGLVNPRSEIDFNGRRAKFSAGYSGVLERYQELSELTRYDQRGRLEARYQMTPRLMFVTRHNVTLTPTTDQLELEGITFTRVGSRMVTSIGGFSYDLSPRAVLKTEYLFQWVDFRRDTQAREDFRFLQGGHAHSPTAEFQYALSRHVKVGGLYLYRHTVIDAGEEVFGTQRAQGLVQVDLGPTTTVRGRAGFDHLKREDIPISETGPSYGASITQRIREASIDGSFERQFIPSFGFGGLMASETFRVGGMVPLGGNRMFASGGFTYRRTDPVILRDVLVELDSYWTNAAVGYHVTRWLRAEGFLAITRQFSSAQGKVERTRVGVQFVTSKPVRIQ